MVSRQINDSQPWPTGGIVTFYYATDLYTRRRNPRGGKSTRFIFDQAQKKKIAPRKCLSIYLFLSIAKLVCGFHYFIGKILLVRHLVEIRSAVTWKSWLWIYKINLIECYCNLCNNYLQQLISTRFLLRLSREFSTESNWKFIFCNYVNRCRT